MTHHQIKEQLTILLDLLPPEQAELVLDFATLLQHRQAQLKDQPPKTQNGSTWETALASAEEYWFHLSEAARQKYAGQIVALLRNQILDSDADLKHLRKRMLGQYPDQPILYLDAEAEQEPPLFVRSPRLQ